MYQYKITVQPLESDRAGEHLSFTATNHDDILAVASRLQGKFHLDPDEANAFAVGLKLFGETVLKHRNQAPFSLIRPAMADFMKALKDQVRSTE